MEKSRATQNERNIQMVEKITGLAQGLVDQVENLPVSEGAKMAMVSMLLGEALIVKGDTVTFSRSPTRKEL